jgi:hypothetical protein
VTNTNTVFFHFAWGPTPTLAAGAFHFAWGPTPTLAAAADSISPPDSSRGPQAFSYARGAPPPLARAAALEDSLSSRGPQALFTIRFVLDDDPDDDDLDDEFGDDEEGEDEEDDENDDEDPDTETWQVSSFEERPKGWLPLDFGW